MAVRKLVTVAGSGDKPRTPTTPLADDDDDFEYAPGTTVVHHKRFGSHWAMHLMLRLEALPKMQRMCHWQSQHLLQVKINLKARSRN